MNPSQDVAAGRRWGYPGDPLGLVGAGPQPDGHLERHPFRMQRHFPSRIFTSHYRNPLLFPGFRVWRENQIALRTLPRRRHPIHFLLPTAAAARRRFAALSAAPFLAVRARAFG